ncbi:Trypsin-2 precursor [Minicystis rosea]|nr:Trypsin-2 precursor [Minicystis rosea]
MGNVRTLTICLTLALAGCAPDGEPVAEATSEIEGGKLDFHDTGVVGVALVDAAGFPRRSCTGTLIAPNLVLTAQHCIANTTAFVDCAKSVFGPPVSVERIRITASPSMWSDDVEWAAAAQVITPPGPSRVCGRDVALVILDHPLEAPPIDPRLDDGVLAEEAYAAIGYGRSSGERNDGGQRRRRDRLHVICVGEDCDSKQVADSEWRGDHGICNGDSGGPAIDATGAVIGVTSRGPAGCERPIYGGIAPHGDWLRDEARVAAQAGDYPEPTWIREPRRRARGDVYAAGGACAATPGAAGGADAWLVLPIVLGLAARARTRRRNTCFRRAPE